MWNNPAVLKAVVDFTLVNPFSAEREKIELQFVEVTGGKRHGTHWERFEGFFRWVAAIPSGKRD